MNRLPFRPFNRHVPFCCFLDWNWPKNKSPSPCPPWTSAILYWPTSARWKWIFRANRANTAPTTAIATTCRILDGATPTRATCVFCRPITATVMIIKILFYSQGNTMTTHSPILFRCWWMAVLYIFGVFHFMRRCQHSSPSQWWIFPAQRSRHLSGRSQGCRQSAPSSDGHGSYLGPIGAQRHFPHATNGR